MSSFHIIKGQWQARVKFKNRYYYLGSYDEEAESERIRKQGQRIIDDGELDIENKILAFKEKIGIRTNSKISKNEKS